RVVKDKGIYELARAFDRCWQEDKDLRLVLVGGFEEHLDRLDEETLKLIQSHSAVILAGWHDEVEYFLPSSQLFVHASSREGCPNVVLQAGAMECPALVSRIPGCIDIVDDLENGLIFNVKDTEDLFNKLKFALNDMPAMRERAIRLREKIENNFERGYIQ